MEVAPTRVAIRPRRAYHPVTVRRLFYSYLHNCIAHPLLFWSDEAGWAARFHDETARRAWPQAHK